MRGSPYLLLLLALLAAGGCSKATSDGNSPGPAGPSSQARVRVENGSSLDVDIFVHRLDGQTIRLGFVPAAGTATFALNPAVTAGSTTLRFEARPVRGSGEATFSEPFTVSPGDEITWSVPAQ